MRILIVLIVIVAASWSAYWFVGARALDRAIRAGIEDARDSGIEVETDRLKVTGFPNRFDTIIDAPRLGFPQSDIAWSAPFLRLFALSYRPNRIIAVLPDTQRIEGPFGTLRIETGTARAAATFKPGPSLTLDHANIVAEGLAVAGAGQKVTVARLLAATRLPEGETDGTVQNIGVTLDDIDLPGVLAARLGGAGAARIDSATLDATLRLSEPLDRRALQGAPIRVRAIRVETLEIAWGDVSLAASGDLEVDGAGIPTGEIEAVLTNWPRALEIASGAGLLPPEQVATARQAMSMLSAMSGGSGKLTVPLTFRDGRIYLGPMPLGPAPRL